jgi:predicted peptidase
MILLTKIQEDMKQNMRGFYSTMKKTLIWAICLLSLTACAQRNGGDKGFGDKAPRFGNGDMRMNSKENDSVFVALKNETFEKFQQFTFEDAATGKTMQYNLLVPDGYDGKTSYPLVLFMADASTVGKDVTTPLTQGYGALEFASDRDQRKHPSFVLVPQYTDWAVQDDWSTTDEVEMTIRLLQYICKEYKIDQRRLYTTGQSMGGMMSFYFNIAHPDLFAASLFVSSQWDTSKMKDFGKRKFFYIVAGGDGKASGGMRELTAVLKKQNAHIDSASWSAKLPPAEQESLAKALIAKGGSINFICFEKGSVLPASGQGMEHLASFDYGYKIAAVRDWLFEQSK